MGLNPAPRATTCAAAWSAGTKATTASSTTPGPTGCKPGTGWQIDPGILHAPGSLVTYEPQVNSDVFAMYPVAGRRPRRAVGSAGEGRPARASSRSRLPARHARLGRQHRSRIRQAPPLRSRARRAPSTEMADAGYCEKWVVYSTPHYSAKELTVFPGRTVTIHDAAAYGTDPGAGLRRHRQARRRNARR